MAGMKITLDSAMRARDVSRPRADHEAAALDGTRPGTGSAGTGGRDAAEGAACRSGAAPSGPWSGRPGRRGQNGLGRPARRPAGWLRTAGARPHGRTWCPQRR